MRDPLPIDAHLEEIGARLRERRSVVVVAPPGAGKTTRVPPALVADGPVILLQPRRMAARAIARRIAGEQGWTIGQEIGWQVRFERQFGPATRLLVATEGILTARLQSDPLLSGYRTVILDEFHERSLYADLSIALVKQAMAARDDLHVVVMSATLDTSVVSAYLGGAPVVSVPGRLHPVAVSYAAGLAPADAVRRTLAHDGGGHLLCFLPGAPEIRRLEEELRRAFPAAGSGAGSDVAILPLHGTLDADAQDKALAPFAGRKVILATNIAETSLTVEGVTDVIDSGLCKVLRHDPALGLDRLQTERISADSAEQRAGRAGRTGPGRCLRLWDERDLLRPHREPEIERADLAGTFLEVHGWGGDPRRFDWLEAPPAERAEAAEALLQDLGAVRDGRITDLGRRLQRLPLHPRLARLLLETGGSAAGAAACAILSEGWIDDGRGAAGTSPRAAATTDSDLLQRADRLSDAPWHVRRAATELASVARSLLGTGDSPAGVAQTGITTPAASHDERFLRATFAAYPDRLARRREAGSDRLVLSSGHGAVLGRESGVRGGEYLVAIDVVAGRRGPTVEALVRMASRVERDWITPTGRAVEHRFEAATGAVRAMERLSYRDLILEERPVAADPAIAGELLAEELLRRGPDEAEQALRRRLRFAGVEIDLPAIVSAACAGRTTLPALDLTTLLPQAARRDLDRLAPATIPLPSGRGARLEYKEDGSVVASVKLQELFGLGATPRIGPRKEPVTFALLSPSGRPVQTTRDLKSFWETTYPEVRKELRARYPKHPWPDDPWTATPTHRTTRGQAKHGGAAPGGAQHAPAGAPRTPARRNPKPRR